MSTSNFYDRYLEKVSMDKSIALGAALLIFLTLMGGFLLEGFFSFQNLKSVLLLAAFLGIASLGQTLCALIGGLDLSIPFVIGSANILFPSLLSSGVPPVLAIVIVLMLGGLVGLVNGALSFRLQGQSLIMSLAVGFMVVGATQIYTSIGSEFGSNVFTPIPEWLRNLAAFNGVTFGVQIPPVVFIWAAISILLIWVMRSTWFGIGIYAVGGSRVAAHRLRISESRTWIQVHGISGFMSATAGVLLLGFSGGGFVGVGDPYLFTTVAAVVIGGTSLLGGSGGYGATILGVLVLTVLTSLLVGLGLSFAAQQAVIGSFIIPMVAIYARSKHIRNQI